MSKYRSKNTAPQYTQSYPFGKKTVVKMTYTIKSNWEPDRKKTVKAVLKAIKEDEQ